MFVVATVDLNLYTRILLIYTLYKDISLSFLYPFTLLIFTFLYNFNPTKPKLLSIIMLS